MRSRLLAIPFAVIALLGLGGSVVMAEPPASSTVANAQPVLPPSAVSVPTPGIVPPAAAALPEPRAIPRLRSLTPSLVARIDLTRQRMDVLADGVPLHSWPISSGRQGFETPRGHYRGAWMARMWFSRKYDDAPMPNAVFFNDGIAVHGTDSVRALGRPASHGCVRLSPANAQTFYALVTRHGLKRTEFQVAGTTPVSRVAAKRGLEPRGATAQVGQRPSPRFSHPLRATGDGLLRGPDGRVFLPRNSPYAGRDSFVHNGVVYMRLR